MKIGFDAKRAFHNFRGLGNYSRTLLEGLAKFYPENEYLLYTTPIRDRRGKLWLEKNQNFKIISPRVFLGKLFPSFWRSIYLADVVKKDAPTIFHGLSHELPPYINEQNIKVVVTIHDILFERLPDCYSAIDRRIYRRKYSHSCRVADLIIAISEQTKNDLVNLWNIPGDKIRVIYQSYSSDFEKICSEGEKSEIKIRFQLPDSFILYVGALSANKNLTGLIRAYSLSAVKEKLVIVGGGSRPYKAELLNLIDELNIQEKVLFLHDVGSKELPAIYQQARCFVYPSFYEGFGIPVIEALVSKVAVVTSKDTSMEEAGGSGALYADPYDHEDLAEKISRVLTDESLRANLIENGTKHAEKFSLKKTTKELHDLYKELVTP